MQSMMHRPRSNGVPVAATEEAARDDDENDSGVTRVIPSRVMEDPGGTSSSIMQPPLGVTLSFTLFGVDGIWMPSFSSSQSSVMAALRR